MSLSPFQRKIRSVGYSKYLPIRFENLSPQLEEKELKDLINSLKNEPSNEHIRNKIVEGHLRLGLSIAGRYAYKNKFRYEDLVGEMFLTLVESINKFCVEASYDDNITPYIISSIHSTLIKFIENDRVIRMPGRTIRYYTAIGSSKLDKMPNQIGLVVDTSPQGKAEDEYEGAGHKKAFGGTLAHITPQTLDDKSENEVLEILDKVTHNFIEKKIIKLRAEGYSYKEISPQVGYSESSISEMIKSIEKRFNKLYRA